MEAANRAAIASAGAGGHAGNSQTCASFRRLRDRRPSAPSINRLSEPGSGTARTVSAVMASAGSSAAGGGGSASITTTPPGPMFSAVSVWLAWKFVPPLLLAFTVESFALALMLSVPLSLVIVASGSDELRVAAPASTRRPE